MQHKFHPFPRKLALLWNLLKRCMMGCMTDSLDYIHHSDSKAIAALFVGRKIVVTDLSEQTLTLDNGVKLRIRPNEGSEFSGGDYFLDSICDFEHAITSVKVESKETADYKRSTQYTLFVYAAGVKVGNAAKNKVKGKVAVVSGDDGNGYYGSGFTIEVIEA